MLKAKSFKQQGAKFLIGGVAVAAIVTLVFPLLNSSAIAASGVSNTVEVSPSIVKPDILPPIPKWEEESLRQLAVEQVIDYDAYTYSEFWYRWINVDGKLTTEPLRRDGLTYERCVKSPYCNPDLEISRTPKP